MAYRKAHGTGASALARVETAPADELPEGVPAEPVPDRDARTGRFISGNRWAAKGGRARGEAVKLRRLLGFAKLDDDHDFRPYQRMAREWRDEHAESVAMNVGGGELSPGVASIIASAALSLAASRYLHDRAAESGDAKLFVSAARLADQSRQSLLTAHEMASREAKAREKRQPVDQPWLVTHAPASSEDEQHDDGGAE